MRVVTLCLIIASVFLSNTQAAEYLRESIANDYEENLEEM